MFEISNHMCGGSFQIVFKRGLWNTFDFLLHCILKKTNTKTQTLFQAHILINSVSKRTCLKLFSVVATSNICLESPDYHSEKSLLKPPVSKQKLH